MLSLLTMVGRLISTENPVVCIPYFFCPSIREGGHGVKEVWRRDGLQAEPGREVKVGKLKSAASKRTVPLNDTAIAMIQDLRKETYFGEDTPLVPGEHGNFTRPVNFRKRYYRILAAAGIEKKGLHSLRHPYVKHTTKKYNSEKQKTQATKIEDLIAWGFCFCIVSYSKRSWTL